MEKFKKLQSITFKNICILLVIAGMASLLSACIVRDAYDGSENSPVQSKPLKYSRRRKGFYPAKFDPNYNFLHTGCYDRMQHDNFRHPNQ